MRYYRLILMVKEGRLLVSDITEHLMDKETYSTGSWDKPITKVVTPNGDLHFISFVKEYLDAMLAGIAVSHELRVLGYNE